MDQMRSGAGDVTVCNCKAVPTRALLVKEYHNSSICRSWLPWTPRGDLTLLTSSSAATSRCTMAFLLYAHDLLARPLAVAAGASTAVMRRWAVGVPPPAGRVTASSNARPQQPDPDVTPHEHHKHRQVHVKCMVSDVCKLQRRGARPLVAARTLPMSIQDGVARSRWLDLRISLV